MRRHPRHISLSFSFSFSLSTPGLAGKKPSFGARRGANHHLLGGIRRAPGRGVPRSRVAGWVLFERRCCCPSLVAFEEAPSRALMRAGCSAGRRGPDPGPRRSPYAWHLTPRGEEVVSLSSDRGALVPSVSQEETVL